jgi:transposase-like protein
MRHTARRERRAAILEEVANGATVRELAEKHSLTPEYIRFIARTAGVPLSRKAKAMGGASLGARILARREKVAELVKAGRCAREIAAEVGVEVWTVRNDYASLGIKPVRDMAAIQPAVAAAKDRAQTMLALYREGYTLAVIGAQFGISRERVRQLMTKHFGTRQNDGGQHAVAAKRAEKALARRNAECLRRNGCSLEQYQEIMEAGRRAFAASGSRYKHPSYAFKGQRNNARHRKIEWHLTFWEWWTIWQRSGHWGQRGIHSGEYVMCRNGDTGPYAVWNVYIALSAENVSSGKSKKDKSLPIGVRRADSGRYTAVRYLEGKNRGLGTYDTPELAYAAYLRAAPQPESQAA